MNQLIAESREFKSKDKIQKSQNEVKLHNNFIVLPWEYFAGLSWTLGDDL